MTKISFRTEKELLIKARKFKEEVIIIFLLFLLNSFMQVYFWLHSI